MHGCLEDLAKLAWMECTWRLASASAACGEPMTLARICEAVGRLRRRPPGLFAGGMHTACHWLLYRRRCRLGLRSNCVPRWLHLCGPDHLDSCLGQWCAVGRCHLRFQQCALHHPRLGPGGH